MILPLVITINFIQFQNAWRSMRSLSPQSKGSLLIATRIRRMKDGNVFTLSTIRGGGYLPSSQWGRGYPPSSCQGSIHLPADWGGGVSTFQPTEGTYLPANGEIPTFQLMGGTYPKLDPHWPG